MPVRGFDDAKNAEAVYTKAEMDVPIGQLDGHIADQTIHVTAAEKTSWNAKVGLDPDTGRVAKDQLPDDTLYSGQLGAANGVASLGADARLPFSQAPLGAWRTVTVDPFSGGIGTITDSVAIAETRATIVINAGSAKYYASYDKASGTLVGIKIDATGTVFGDVTGDIGFTTAAHNATALTADGSGLTITETKMGGSADFPGATIMIRQDC